MAFGKGKNPLIGQDDRRRDEFVLSVHEATLLGGARWRCGCIVRSRGAWAQRLKPEDWLRRCPLHQVTEPEEEPKLEEVVIKDAEYF